MGVVSDLIQRELGRPTQPRVNPLVDEVGTSAVRIAGNNPNRVALLVINLSGNTVYVAPDNGPASSRGIRLGGGGGTLSLSVNEDFHLVTWEWWAIADAAASDIFVLEVEAR